MEKELNWAVIGTGVIANEMAQALQRMDKTLYGVANRTQAKAIDFAKKYGVKKVYDEIDEVFDDENVDIIYLATSHNTHYQFMKKALEHGKHLFVEKSITLNSRELDEMIALAKEKNLILAEAMTIWHMPIYKAPPARFILKKRLFISYSLKLPKFTVMICILPSSPLCTIFHNSL